MITIINTNGASSKQYRFADMWVAVKFIAKRYGECKDDLLIIFDIIDEDGVYYAADNDKWEVLGHQQYKPRKLKFIDEYFNASDEWCDAAIKLSCCQSCNDPVIGSNNKER